MARENYEYWKDRICVVYGSQIPVVLRPIETHFEMIAPCLVLSFMDGEAVLDMEEGGCKVENSEIW